MSLPNSLLLRPVIEVISVMLRNSARSINGKHQNRSFGWRNTCHDRNYPCAKPQDRVEFSCFPYCESNLCDLQEITYQITDNWLAARQANMSHVSLQSCILERIPCTAPLNRFDFFFFLRDTSLCENFSLQWQVLCIVAGQCDSLAEPYVILSLPSL